MADTDETPWIGSTSDGPWWRDFADLYLTFDRRTLGLTRILLGFYLIGDLLRRTPDWWKMFSNEGVLPAHMNLFRPQSSGWSLVNAFSTRQELWVLWALIMGVYLCVLVGYRTRVAQVLAAIAVASMNGRVLLIENGGYVVQNLLLLWTAFLPLGDRFSIDALRSSMQTVESSEAELNQRESLPDRWRLDPHVTLVGLVVMLQLFSIYFFNVVHKKGPAWKDGTAVHYVLYVDRMATPLIAAVRDYIPSGVEIFLSKFVMVLEATVPVCVLSPIARVWSRRIALVSIIIMHIGFGSSFVLGPFAWALCVFSVLLFSTEDWEIVERAMRRPSRACKVSYREGDGMALWLCRLLKRLDRFELLRFEANEQSTLLRATPLHGDRVSGMRAARLIARALPLGPLLSAMLRLPGMRQLGDVLLLPVSARLLAFFGVGRAGGARSVRRRHLSRDEEHTLDPGSIGEWLANYFRLRKRGSSPMVTGAYSFVLGGFFYLYGAPMVTWTAKRFEQKIDMKALAVFGQTRTDLIEWLGVLLLIGGGYLLFSPLLKMVLTVPSSIQTKRRRFLAGAREGLIFLFWMAAINQALSELWSFRGLRLPHPSPMREMAHKMRYLQGWFMFSPNPVMDDGTILVDAVTVDGRHIDPFSPDTFRVPRPTKPDYDLLKAQSYGYNQIWSDYYNRMHLPQNTSFRRAMKAYIYRLPERTGNPNDAVVKGEVHWLHDMNPRFGKHNSWGMEVKKLFSFTNPDPDVQRRYRAHSGEPEARR